MKISVSTSDGFSFILLAKVIWIVEKQTYMCKGAQRAQKANNYQAQNKEFTSVREVIWVFIQHCSDDRLQPTKLKHTHTIMTTCWIILFSDSDRFFVIDEVTLWSSCAHVHVQLSHTYSAIQSKRDHHHKKDDCKEDGAGHVRYGLWVCDEEQTWTWKPPRDHGEYLTLFLMRFSFSSLLL